VLTALIAAVFAFYFWFATEGDMPRFNWNALLQGLVLIRMGQELGTDSRLAKAIHDLVGMVMVVWR